MGKVEKKVKEKQDKIDAMSTKLIKDLIWYCNAMNKVLSDFNREINAINGALDQCIKEYKGEKSVL